MRPPRDLLIGFPLAITAAVALALNGGTLKPPASLSVPLHDTTSPVEPDVPTAVAPDLVPGTLSHGFSQPTCGSASTLVVMPSYSFVFSAGPHQDRDHVGLGPADGGSVLSVSLLGDGLLNDFRDMNFSLHAYGSTAGAKFSSYSDPSRSVDFDAAIPQQRNTPYAMGDGATIVVNTSSIPDGVSFVRASLTGHDGAGEAVDVEAIAKVGKFLTPNGVIVSVATLDPNGVERTQAKGFDTGIQSCGLPI